MRPTKTQIALALLMGTTVVIVAITLQFTGVQAQDLVTVKVARSNHHTARYVETPDGDGGVVRRDLLQEAADDCDAAWRAFKGAKEQHVDTAGTPSVESLKQRRTFAKGVCNDYRTLAASIEVARVVYEGADIAYDCEYLEGPCPDGGTP